MKELIENRGIPRTTLLLMAIITGLTVANLYYNQPLLEMMRQDLGTTQVKTNWITVITQAGYAFGLCFIIPMGDLYSRRKILTACMSLAGIMGIVIAVANSIYIIWAASFILGMCSVVPQIFMPIASQFSKPENKSRNMGILLSGMLTGILLSRVISGLVGAWFGWREMFGASFIIMVLCLTVTLSMLPAMKNNFSGTYLQLMKSVVDIFRTKPTIRLYSFRSALCFGSMMTVWACMAFHLAQPPFNAGSEMVGLLGLCGAGSALVSTGIGAYVPKFGIRNFSIFGCILQIASWGVALAFGDTYWGMIIAVIFVDIGLQCLQLSNQSGCISELPSAANRVNTIFMTTYFIGGACGTFLAGLGWNHMQWSGVCIVGLLLPALSLIITLFSKK